MLGGELELKKGKEIVVGHIEVRKERVNDEATEGATTRNVVKRLNRKRKELVKRESNGL